MNAAPSKEMSSDTPEKSAHEKVNSAECHGVCHVYFAFIYAGLSLIRGSVQVPCTQTQLSVAYKVEPVGFTPACAQASAQSFLPQVSVPCPVV